MVTKDHDGLGLTDESIESSRVVIVNRKTGRFNGAIDAGGLALQMLALNMTVEGQGGGIVDLLIPKDYSRIMRLIRLRSTSVLSRRSIRSKKTGNRAKERDFVLNDDVAMAKLGALFSVSNPAVFTSEAFSRWIVRELKNKNDAVYRLVRSGGVIPENLADRRPSWWQNLIAERRKRLKIQS